MSRKQEIIVQNERIIEKHPNGAVKESYRELKIGKKIICATSIFIGNADVERILEKSTMRKVFAEVKAPDKDNSKT